MTMSGGISGNSNTNTHNESGQFGDTTLTKVFVGGLAWETPKEAMRDYFQQFGDILEAVIISDKLTGRSKGYGFVTFKEAEAARKACEDATPMINGRRANCNLASLGARRPRPAAAQAAQQQPPKGSIVGPRSGSPAVAPPASHVQWYYPPAATPASPYHQHHHHPNLPFYGYFPPYIAAGATYNHKVGYAGGSYLNGHFSPQVYTGQPTLGANALMPWYPLYHFHQSQAMGLPGAHMFPPTTAAPMATAPGIITKPVSMAPNSAVCLAVE